MNRTFFGGGGEKTFRIIAAAVLTALTALALGWMFYDYFVLDPFDPALAAGANYGHNEKGAFGKFALITFIEFIVLAAVLLIAPFARLYWLRILILQIALLGWTFIMAVSGMHAGGVHAVHTRYLFVVNFALFLLLTASIAARIARSRRNRLESND